MNNGYIDLPEVLQKLADTDELVYRIALLPDGGEWRVYSLFIDRFPRDGSNVAPKFAYDYGAAFFSAGVIDGEMAKDWLYQRSGSITPPGQSGPVRRFTLQPLNGKIPWYRFPSYAPQDFQRMPRPMTRYEVTGYGGAQYQTDTGFLLSNDGPFFPDFRSALLRLVYMAKDIDAIPQTPSAGVIVRIADTRAWLSHNALSSTAIEVTISGTGTGGAQLTITGAGESLFERKNVASGTFNCPLPDGIPSPLWIMLSRGNEWLDYYQRDERWSAFNSAQQPNVTMVSEDVSTDIEALIYRGEGVDVEFKSQIDKNDADGFLKTVAAFANASGGVILIGVQDRTGVLMGVKTDVAAEKDRIMNLIWNGVFPEPVIQLTDAEVDHRRIIVVRVDRSDAAVYGIHTPNTLYFVRRGANSFPARPEELERIVKLRNPHPQDTSPLAGYRP